MLLLSHFFVKQPQWIAQMKRIKSGIEHGLDK